MGHFPQSISSVQGLGEELNRLRQERGLTIRALAKASGIPSSTLGGYLVGKHLPPPTRPQDFSMLLGALGIPPQDHHRWLDALWRLHQRRGATLARTQDPYLGLRAFDVTTADLFFGRDHEVERLAAMIRASVNSLIVVVGASGSGKTSLLAAGLLPCLAEQTSVDILALSADHLVAQRHRLIAIATSWDHEGSADDRRVIVLDQFEQVWARGSTEESRRQLFAALSLLIEQPGAVVVIALRSDFYEAASREEFLARALQERQFLLGPMGAEALRATIIEPAATQGVVVDPELVKVLLRDAGGTPADQAAILPHLSHTLAQMWQSSTTRRLTLDDYEAVGRLEGAIAKSAEEAWSNVPEDIRPTARRLLLAMVTLIAGQPSVSHPLPRNAVSEEEFEQALGEFIRRRLVTASGTEVRIGHEVLLRSWPRLESWIDEDRQRLTVGRLVAREALDWESADRDSGLLLRGRRLLAAEEWAADPLQPVSDLQSEFIRAGRAAVDSVAAKEENAHRRTRRLLFGVAVLAAIALTTSGGLIAARAQITGERDIAQSRQLAAQSTTFAGTDPPLAAALALRAETISDTLQSRSALASASAGPQVAIVPGPVGPRMVAVSRVRSLLVATGTSATADLIDVSHAVPESLGTVATPVAGPEDSIFALALSPDGSLLAMAGTAGLIRIIDLRTPNSPVQVGPDITVAPAGENKTVYALAFGDNGTELLAATPAEGVRRWRTSATAPAVELPRLSPPSTGAPLTAIGLAPDGSVAAGDNLGRLTVWPAVRGESEAPAGHSITLDDGFITSIVWNGTGWVAGTRSSRAYSVPAAASLAGPPAPLARFDSWVNAGAPSSTEGAVTLGSSDSTVRTILPDGAVLEQFSTPSPVTSVAVIDPQRLAVGMVDGRVLIRTSAQPPTPNPNAGVFFARWSKDMPRVASFPDKGENTVGLWSVADPQAGLPPVSISTLLPPPEAIETLGRLSGSGDISRDGTLVVSGTTKGGLIGWDVTEPARPRVVFSGMVAKALIEQLAFVSDDQVLVASDDASTQLVRVRGGVGIPDVMRSFSGATGAVLNAAMSRDGAWVAAGGTAGSVWLYGRDDPTPVTTIKGEGYVYSLGFTPDGSMLAVGGANKRVDLYSLADPRHPVLEESLTGPNSTVYSLDIGPDGRIAAASTDAAITIWTPGNGTGGDGKRYEHTHTLPTRASMYSVQWAPDGRRLIATGQKNTLMMWATDTAAARAGICATGSAQISAVQWRVAVPDLAFIQPCP